MCINGSDIRAFSAMKKNMMKGRIPVKWKRGGAYEISETWKQ